METILEVRDFTKRYSGVLAVDNVTFEVSRGEAFGLLGPNGAGKTTTIRVLTGQIKPTSGDIRIAGFDIARESTRAKERVGIVPEVSNLYDEMSAWDNLIFAAQLYGVPRKERATRASELLTLFDLHDRRKDRVGKFSKGMKRRVAIAAALVHEPEVLFLDEPTAGLDVQSTRMIQDHVKELNQNGTTLFLTTHYIQEADKICERIAIINKGRIVATGSPEHLKGMVEDNQVIEVSFSPLVKGLEANLKALKGVTGVSRVGDKFKLYIARAAGVVPALVDFSRENGLEILSINTITPSLEDAFVKITGISPDIMASEKESQVKGKK